MKRINARDGRERAATKYFRYSSSGITQFCLRRCNDDREKRRKEKLAYSVGEYVALEKLFVKCSLRGVSVG